MNSTIAARLYAALIACTILFQIGLAAGMPWGELAWGGSHPGTLPRQLRIASDASVAVLLALAFVVLVRAGLLLQSWKHWLVSNIDVGGGRPPDASPKSCRTVNPQK